jgi:hypothetical protein
VFVGPEIRGRARARRTWSSQRATDGRRTRAPGLRDPADSNWKSWGAERNLTVTSICLHRALLGRAERSGSIFLRTTARGASTPPEKTWQKRPLPIKVAVVQKHIYEIIISSSFVYSSELFFFFVFVKGVDGGEEVIRKVAVIRSLVRRKSGSDNAGQ